MSEKTKTIFSSVIATLFAAAIVGLVVDRIELSGWRGKVDHIVNQKDRTAADVTYLEVGDRTPGDEGQYPADDLVARLDANGQWQFTHKDGRPY